MGGRGGDGCVDSTQRALTPAGSEKTESPPSPLTVPAGSAPAVHAVGLWLGDPSFGTGLVMPPRVRLSQLALGLVRYQRDYRVSSFCTYQN